MEEPRQSAALETTEKPVQRPINMRRAIAGIHILEGNSLRQSLLKAGFSDSVASSPARYGHTGEHCIQEAKLLNPEASPLALVEGARRVALRTLRGLEAMDPAELAAKPAPVAKLLEVAERYHGGEKPDPGDGVRSFVQRAVMLDEVMRLLRDRGVLSVENPHSRNPAAVVEIDAQPAKE